MRRTRQGRLASRFAPTLVVTLAVGALLALSALPAAAEVYHVKLRNGTVIDTAYQPQQPAWDATMVVLLTDAGNWIGVPQKDVDSVVTESSVRGFGIALNFNTVAIGWAPNDLPESTPASAQSAALQALQNAYARQEQQSHYTIPQFVSTEGTQGIPSRFVGVAPGIPGALPQPLPVAIPAAPAAPSAPANIPNQPAGQPNQ